MPPACLMLAVLAVSPANAHRAVELGQRALREYRVGEFTQALRDVQRAYLLDPLPVLLFNAAKCEQALENWSLAERFYRNYLWANPNARNRAETEKLIAEMVGKQRPAPAPRATTPAGDKPPPYASSTIGHGAAASSTGASTGKAAAAASTGASIGNVGRGLVPRRRESREASRARETPHPQAVRLGPQLAHVSSPAPLAATAAPSITTTAPRRRPVWLTYAGAALLAGAGVSGYYAGYGFAGAGMATANGKTLPPAARGPYTSSAGGLQELGAVTLFTASALAIGGVTLLVLGLTSH